MFIGLIPSVEVSIENLQRQFQKNYLFCSLRRNPSSPKNPEFYILFQLYIQTHNSPLLHTGFAPSGTKI